MPYSYHQVTAAQLPPESTGQTGLQGRGSEGGWGCGGARAWEGAGAAAHQERMNDENVAHFYRAVCARLSPR